MAVLKKKIFPETDVCPGCGRQLTIYYDTENFKVGFCNKMKGHCGGYFYWEGDQHRS